MTTLTEEQSRLRDLAKSVAETHLRPQANQVDRERLYPIAGLRRLGEAGLLGLLVPSNIGGGGGSLLDLALVLEQIGSGCASTAMCFLMHACGAAVIAAKANPEQRERESDQDQTAIACDAKSI